MKKAITALLLGTALVAKATTLSFSTTRTGPAVFDSTNTLVVPNGSLVRVGTISNESDPNATFVEFGTSALASAGANPATARPGKLVGDATPSLAEANHTQFNGQTIYLWIYNAPTAGAATQQGIFKTNLVFPNNDTGGFGDSIIVTSATDITSVVAAPGYSAPQILAGDANDSKHFVLGAVPEPTASLLALLGVVAIGVRRRR